jgi:hypothetical protein
VEVVAAAIEIVFENAGDPSGFEAAKRLEDTEAASIGRLRMPAAGDPRNDEAVNI